MSSTPLAAPDISDCTTYLSYLYWHVNMYDQRLCLNRGAACLWHFHPPIHFATGASAAIAFNMLAICLAPQANTACSFHAAESHISKIATAYVTLAESVL